MADRFTAAFGLSFIAIGLLLWFTALCEKDGTLRRVAATFRKLPKYLLQDNAIGPGATHLDVD